MKKKIAIFSFSIAFVLGIPFQWIQYKGKEGVSTFHLIDLGIHNLFFDFTILSLNTLVIYFVLSRIQEYRKSSNRE